MIFIFMRFVNYIKYLQFIFKNYLFQRSSRFTDLAYSFMHRDLYFISIFLFYYKISTSKCSLKFYELLAELATHQIFNFFILIIK